MYHVIGNSPKKVELKDLNDSVYYKQQKVYSDSQYRSSVDLQRAIERKTLIVLRKSEDSTGSFDVNTAIISTEIKTSDSSPKIDLLLERVQSLESSMKSQPSIHGMEAMAVILKRLEDLEKNPSSSVDLSSIQESLKSLEARMLGNNSDGLLEKLENIINRAGTGPAPIKENAASRPEEVYIPNIKVEDAHSHINLEVRKLDNGDSVADSLKKLKELRSKSK